MYEDQAAMIGVLQQRIRAQRLERCQLLERVVEFVDGRFEGDIAQPIVDTLKHYLGSDQPALGPAFVPEAAPERGDVVDRICALLDREIRPSVAMDGGDISFASFRNGTVELHMRGACSGCPSSTATLKLAIESLLRAEIPEVSEVVAVS